MCAYFTVVYVVPFLEGPCFPWIKKLSGSSFHLRCACSKGGWLYWWEQGARWKGVPNITLTSIVTLCNSTGKDAQASCSLKALVLMAEPQKPRNTSPSHSMEWEGAGNWKSEAPCSEKEWWQARERLLGCLKAPSSGLKLWSCPWPWTWCVCYPWHNMKSILFCDGNGRHHPLAPARESFSFLYRIFYFEINSSMHAERGIGINGWLAECSETDFQLPCVKPHLLFPP